MNRIHAEPERKERACPSCGLPHDATERARIEARLSRDAGPWAFCPECGEATCRELRALCAEGVER